MTESVPRALGAVVVPLPHARDIHGNPLPEVPHTVLHPGTPPAVVGVVRTVLHQLVGPVEASALTAYLVYVDAARVRPAAPQDLDPQTRFRVATGRVHEWVAGRTVCLASARRRELLTRLVPTTEPVDCRDCLRVLASREAAPC